MKGGTCLCVVLCVMGLTAGLSGGADVSPDPTDVRAAVDEETVCPPPLCHSRESGNPEKSLSRPGQSSAGERKRGAEIVGRMMNGDITVIRDHPDVVHLKDAADRSVLHYAIAAKTADDAVALELIARGADVNAATALVAWTPLHVAAALNKPRVVSALLTRGADVNAQTRVGAWTPLAVAEVMAQMKSKSAETVEAVALLRKAGGKSRYDPAAMPSVWERGFGDDGGDQDKGDGSDQTYVLVFTPWENIGYDGLVRQWPDELADAFEWASIGDPGFVPGSFTAVGADERLVFEPMGTSTWGTIWGKLGADERLVSDIDIAETGESMTAVGLIDKDGRTHVLWVTDWFRSFHELCVDPRTGLHHAIFRQGHDGSGGVPSFLYMHYDADTGTLTEGFEESTRDDDYPKPGGVKGGQCRWRELQAEHTIVNDLLGVLRATGPVSLSASGEPSKPEPGTTLPTRVIPSSVVESSLASLRELEHLVAVSADAADSGEGLDADPEYSAPMILESPRWKIIVVLLKAIYLGDYGYGDGVVLVQDKTRGEWRSIFDCGDISLAGLRDQTVAFRGGDRCDCYHCSVAVDLLTNEVKDAELYWELELERDAREEEAAVARADSAGTASVSAESGRPQGPHAEEAERQRQAKRKTPLEILGEQMVHVRGGTFKMGCTAEQDDCGDEEKPVHRVQVSDFEIGKYEVTQEVWEAVMGKNPSAFALDDEDYSQHPVENVSWNDVQAFLKKLNEMTGAGYRLPTEAEWEYAARGGQRSKGYEYAGSETPGLVAWYGGSWGTSPVGEKHPNELGLYDMSGNVWEWTADCWNGEYVGAPSDGSAWQSGDCLVRVLRGGSWYDRPRDLRSALRIRITAWFRNDYNGFRLARTLTPPGPEPAARKDKPVRQGSEMRERPEHNLKKVEAKP